LVGEQPTLAFLAKQNGNEWEAEIDLRESYLSSASSANFEIEIISNGNIVTPVKMPIRLEQDLTAVNVFTPSVAEKEPEPEIETVEEPITVPSIKSYFKKSEEPEKKDVKDVTPPVAEVKVEKPRFSIINQMAKTDQINETVKEKLKQIETPVAAPVVTKIPSVDIKKYTTSARLNVLKEMANKK
jgi:hypothetical protein